MDMEFINLPPTIQEIILSDKNVDNSKKIAKEFDLTDKQFDELFSTIISISSKEILLDQLIPKLKEIGLEENKTKQLAVRIIGLYLLPLSNFLGGDLVKQLQDLGGDIADYQLQLKQGQVLVIEDQPDDADTMANKEDKKVETTTNPKQSKIKSITKSEDVFDIESEAQDVKTTLIKPEVPENKISVEDLTNEVINKIEK